MKHLKIGKTSNILVKHLEIGKTSNILVKHLEIGNIQYSCKAS